MPPNPQEGRYSGLPAVAVNDVSPTSTPDAGRATPVVAGEEPSSSCQSHSGDSGTDHSTPTGLKPLVPTETVDTLLTASGDHDVQEGRSDTTDHVPPMGTFVGHFATQRSYAGQEPPDSSMPPLETSISMPSSAQSSSSSLKAMAQRDSERGGVHFVGRALSTRSSHGQLRGRRLSHSKSASTSQPAVRRWLNADYPTYPDQSFASLHTQFYPLRPSPSLRTRSSHPAQNALYHEMSTWSKPGHDQPLVPPGTRTADHTPVSSPALFSSAARAPSTTSFDEDQTLPQLHHLQMPKETHTAEIEHDVFSGNKFINNYEIVQELGRGEHGKVKLGRDVEKSTLVAIKIVPRYSVKRRLGKLGAPEDRTRREVAILKKARHPNVVSLLEVIDDPNKNKVYLILEYVEKGEIKWRKSGVREVLIVNNTRFEQERSGITLTTEVSERDLFNVAQAQRRHEQQERARASHLAHPPNWSLEYGGEEEEEDAFSDISRSASRTFYESSNPSRTSSHDAQEAALAGSMYGAYMPEAVFRGRKFSIATSAVSHMSSELDFDDTDDEHAYVPAMTLEEARRAFRDTLLGLEFLHFIGIIHRDIKPANLLVASNGTVKISDFGVSYLGRPISDEDPDNRLTEKDVSQLDDEKELARSVGTPAFWAPELCYEDPSMFEERSGPRITGALDLWALGITLYCMIYARLPFYATDEMGLHEAVCRAEVFQPKTRLVPVEMSRDKPTSHGPRQMNCNKRTDYELKFELVPDTVRDLIRRLLIKDPAKRMTIPEAKRHPWVVEGITDPSQWIKGPDLEKEGKTRILEVDEKEMYHAVVKRNIIERALNSAGRFAGSLLGRRDTRRRAPSNATSPSHSSESIASPSASTASAVGKAAKFKDSRRASLRGDELVTALRTSRENTTEHPLAQSETASPVGARHSAYFDDSTSYGKAASTGCTPVVEQQEYRPRGPDRATSAMSTADSVKTIRPSKVQRASIAEVPHDFEPPVMTELGFKSRVEGLWEGTTRTFARLASRERRSHRSDRSPTSSRHSSESDAHAGPSLAVSITSASGAIETPGVLRATTTMSPIDGNASPPTSMMSAPAPPTIAGRKFTAPASSEAAFEQAQEVNQRRLIQEAYHEAEAAAAATTTRPRSQATASSECPPSPDDILFLEQQRSKVMRESYTTSTLPGPIQAAPSASTIASSVDDYGHSSVSQSMSNPSFGIISGASSPPGESFLLAEYKDRPSDAHPTGGEVPPAFMRTADTITEHGRLMPQVAAGEPLEARLDHSQADGDDGSDESSEEEGIVMGGPKRRV